METEKKLKLNLDDLKIQSFVTNLDEDQAASIFGGESAVAMRLGNQAGVVIDVCRGGGGGGTQGCSKGCVTVTCGMGNCR